MPTLMPTIKQVPSTKHYLYKVFATKQVSLLNELNLDN